MSMQRASVIALILSVACIAGFAPLPGHAAESALKKHSTRLIETEEDGKRYWYDDRIRGDEAKALFRHFKKNSDDPVPLIYAVPGLRGYFVVSSWDSRLVDKSDFGRRLYLVRKGKNGFEDIDRTKGAGDSYILDPVFFTGQGRILVLAEVGTEYSWGLLVYEVDRKRLSSLGSLDAAIEGEFDAADPTPFAGVKYLHGRWTVEFTRDLVLDPGGLEEQRIKRKGNKPIVFEYDGSKFAPKAGTYTIVTESSIMR